MVLLQILVHKMQNANKSHITQTYIQPAQVTSYHFTDDGSIPNNPLLPLLVYKAALAMPSEDPASIAEAVFTANNWHGTWRNGIYPFHHYHSTAHEVLCICRGEAKVHFGGEQGIKLSVSLGDVVAIPAGVGHKNLGSSADLLVVGAYPQDQQWDLCRGNSNERPQALHNISVVPLPSDDPVYGMPGPLIEYWYKGQ